MKKFYEAPVVEELYANAPALMSGAELSGNTDVMISDESGVDVRWNESILG